MLFCQRILIIHTCVSSKSTKLEHKQQLRKHFITIHYITDTRHYR